jgi:hypothetical protein
MIGQIREKIRTDAGQTFGAVIIAAAMYGIPIGIAFYADRNYEGHSIEGKNVDFDRTDPYHIVLGRPGLSRTTYWDDDRDGTLDRARFMMPVPRRFGIIQEKTPQTDPVEFAEANHLYGMVRR